MDSQACVQLYELAGKAYDSVDTSAMAQLARYAVSRGRIHELASGCNILGNQSMP